MTAQIVALQVLSIISVVIQVPLLAWHGKHKNIPQICLIGWLVVLNLNSFISSFVWSSDNPIEWWSGKGYCDIIVRIKAAANTGVLCAVTAIARNLAIIISDRGLRHDVDSFRTRAIDAAICLVFPTIIFAVISAAMVMRYFLVQYEGCGIPLTSQWPSLVTCLIWAPVWACVVVYYTAKALILYIRKRQEMKNLLHCSNCGLSTEQFLRLLVFCSIVGVVLLPLCIVNTVINGLMVSQSGSTGSVGYYHWDVIARYTNQSINVTLWVYIGVAFVVFGCLGTGSDMRAGYRRLAIKVSRRQSTGLAKSDHPTTPASPVSPTNTTYGLNSVDSFSGKDMDLCFEVTMEPRSATSSGSRSAGSDRTRFEESKVDMDDYNAILLGMRKV